MFTVHLNVVHPTRFWRFVRYLIIMHLISLVSSTATSVERVLLNQTMVLTRIAYQQTTYA